MSFEAEEYIHSSEQRNNEKIVYIFEFFRGYTTRAKHKTQLREQVGDDNMPLMMTMMILLFIVRYVYYISFRRLLLFLVEHKRNEK